MAIKILYGDEPYRIDYEKEMVLQGVENPSMNYTHLQGSFTEEALSKCSTFPFFEDRRVVLVDTDTLKGLDTDSFKKYLEHPVKSTDLVVIVRKVDSRLKIFKTLKEYLVPCNKVTTPKDLEQVILFEVKRNGARITPAALKEFTERINYFAMEDVTLLMVKDFIDNLSAISKEISEDMVKRYVPAFKEADVYSLAGLIKEKKADALLGQLNMLSKDEAIGTLSLLLYSFRVAFKEKFYSLREIGGRESLFSEYGAETLEKAVRLITDRIAGIKSGFIPDETVLKLTVAELLNAL